MLSSKYNQELEDRFTFYLELFGARLKEVIQKKKINPTRLAAELCLTPVTIYKYQKGDTSPSNILEKLIAYVLEIDPGFFYDHHMTLDEASRLFKERETAHARSRKQAAADKEVQQADDAQVESSIKKKAYDLIKRLPDDEVKKIIKIINIITPDPG